MLDDMEDGDAIPCNRQGNWSVGGGGSVTPLPGAHAPGIDLTGDDITKRAPSLRALHLSGTLDAGGYASLVLPLGSVKLAAYKEVDFWARTDGSTDIMLRVAVNTTTSNGDPFFTTATISSNWGESGNMTKVNNVPLLGALVNSVATATADDLAASSSIEFQYQAGDNSSLTTFGFWLDDVQLKVN